MSDLINIAVDSSTLTRIFSLGTISFFVSMLLTPIYTTIAYKQEWWKKPRTNAVTGEKSTMFTKLHAAKHDRHIPTMAGIIFVVSVAIVTILLNLTRSETWLPLTMMLGAAGIGFIDDSLNIRSLGAGVAGMAAKMKMVLITLLGLFGGWWFYAKLDVSSIHIPLVENSLHLGWLIVPLFILVIVATANAVNITDGLDGLAGGLAAIAFGAYTVIAFLEGRYGVAGFCLTMVGALLSYTWFNIFPARFFMGDVGSFGLGAALGVVAMLTDTVLILPVIGIVFVAEAGSSAIQILSKKLRNGKKIFKIAPIHHHFEAMGWPETKVTMRFWVIGQVAATLGLIIFLLGRPL